MLTLSGGHSGSLVVAPEHGGAIVGWMQGRHSLLRRAQPAAVVGGNSHAMGCFPLVPYGNRIAGGRFCWEGCNYQLEHNFGDHPNSIHGIGWQRAWTVEAVTATSASLSLVHMARGEQARAWPFAFESSLTYVLLDGGLMVTLRATNRHDRPAPMGIGLHPYFPRVSDASLGFTAGGVWVNGRDSLPDHTIAVAGEWDHAEMRPVAADRLDNCFTGWTSPVHLQAGPASLEITASEAFRNLQVFTPSWADFFCVEPVSHAPDAINRPDLPSDQAMRVLPPGETLGGTIRLSLCGRHRPDV